MAKKHKRHGKQVEKLKAPPNALSNQLSTMADFWPKPSPAKDTTRQMAKPTPLAPVKAAPRPPTGSEKPKDVIKHAPSTTASRPKVIPPTISGSTAKASPPPERSNQAPLSPQQKKYREIIESRLREKFVKPININLGIDLGTSFTKVVWRSGDSAYPVCFGARTNRLDDYLVPSVVTFDGKVFTTGVDSADKSFNESPHKILNFKMCMACSNSPQGGCGIQTCTLSNWHTCMSSPRIKGREVEIVIALFLAKLISRSRSIIIKQLERQGVSAPVRWNANLAVPEKFMDESPVLEGFEHVFRTAWLMAGVVDEQPGLSSVEDLIDCYQAAKEIETGGCALDCFVYPEVGAEVASVTMSRTARPGLYAFVDIGAGTVDASVFRLHKQGGDHNHNTYAADVVRAGAAHVEIKASRKLALISVDWFKGIKENRNDGEVETKRVGETLNPFLNEALDELKVEVKNDLIQLFRQAYDKEIGEDRWSDLQLIIGGGGAQLLAYRQAACEAFSLKNRSPRANLTEVDLELPRDFRMEGLSPKVFHRFAVAYGLSYHVVHLPTLVLASDVKPLSQDGRKRGPIIDPTDDG